MPEKFVREELEILGIHVLQLHLRSCRREQETAKAPPPFPALYYVEIVGAGVGEYALCHRTLPMRISVETYAAPRGPLQVKRCQRFGHT
jgi:hypothetical protein